MAYSQDSDSSEDEFDAQFEVISMKTCQKLKKFASLSDGFPVPQFSLDSATDVPRIIGMEILHHWS